MKRQAVRLPALLLAGVMLLTGSSCFFKSKKPTTVEQAVRQEEEPQISRHEEPVPPPEPSLPQIDLEKRIAERDAEIRTLRADNAQKGLLLAEQDSTIQDLHDLLELRRRQLDDAIQEVVRAKAAQRSVESQAEAAAQMAETEIALETFRTELGGRPSPELIDAERQLELSNKEYEAQNFGGALYLAFQAKAKISEGTRKLEEQTEMGGTTYLESPLTFTLNSRSNLRRGPGLEFGVIQILDKGVTVTGDTLKGSWVQVEREDGTRGWIHEDLLDAG